ncbi:ribonuclease H [Achaetomium macrosporum]|uniref:Ribonuclease H n=1 Tax=Achaetomium macrosporum TaxID=79813 RepID=A0AAN7C0V0_9PEZI|nr:ribonuclease H [Achaetomium macrosporum]
MEPGVHSFYPYRNGGSSRRRLTRRSNVRPATVFVPQDASLSPEAHFPLQTSVRATFPRFINRFDSREILVVVDGSCINNGRHANKLQEPIGGCAFVFKGSPSGSVAFRLEREGPDGSPAEHTSNRAKLRAVIAALQFRAWGGEGWRRVVILTDLEYIVWGATRWLPLWVARRWRRPRGRGMVMNRDLWEELQYRIEELRALGCEVSFWLVTDEGEEHSSRVIARAKEAARRAARECSDEQVEKFTRLCGILT